MSAIPVIDVASIVDGSNPERVGIETTRVCEQIGFFCIENHGVATNTVHDAWRDGRWLFVPARPRSFIVNIGNLLETWTGGRFVSTYHGVLHETPEERYSIGYFAAPEYDVVVRRLDGSADYEPIRTGAALDETVLSNWDESQQ